MKTQKDIKEMVINLEGMLQDEETVKELTTRQQTLLLGVIFGLAWVDESRPEINNPLKVILSGP